MVKKRGIPKELLESIDINKKNPIKPVEVNVLVEPHQSKIPIPRNIAIDLKLEKGAKCLMLFNKKNKEIICKFK